MLIDRSAAARHDWHDDALKELHFKRQSQSSHGTFGPLELCLCLLKCNVFNASSCQCCYTLAVAKQHISPLAVFQMKCLQCICGISLHDHVPNVVILNRCNTLSVESQLQGKRLGWLGHVFRMPNDRLPKKLLFGEVKGLRPPGRPTSSFNDVALRDCQNCQQTWQGCTRQAALERRDLSCTHLAHHELESAVIITGIRHDCPCAFAKHILD